MPSAKPAYEEPWRSSASRERTRSCPPRASDSIVTRSSRSAGSTMRSRSSTRTKSRSFSRPATSFETAEVVHFEAPARRAAGIGVDERHEPVHPSGRKRRGRLVHAMGVIAKCLVEHRQLADGAVDEIGLGRSLARVDVGLNRHEQRIGGVRELAEDGLAADHDEVALVGNRGGCAEDVLKGGAIHRRP